MGQDVFGADGPVGTSRVNQGDVDAMLFRQTPRFGRNFWSGVCTGCGASFCRRNRRRWHAGWSRDGACGWRSRSGSGRFSGQRFARLKNPSDDRADGDNVTFVGSYASENTIGGCFDFDNGFVGFNFEKGLTLDGGLTFFLSPRQELSSLLRHFECGHYNADGHKYLQGRNAA
jgi:hypothetical protein